MSTLDWLVGGAGWPTGLTIRLEELVGRVGWKDTLVGIARTKSYIKRHNYCNKLQKKTQVDRRRAEEP